MQLHKSLIIAAQLLCETLPISSSTHVWMVDFFWNKYNPGALKIGTELFMDLLFLPTFLVLIVFFRHHIKHLFKTIFNTPKYGLMSSQYKHWWGIMLRVAGYLIAATAAFAGVFLSLKYLGAKILLPKTLEWVPPIIGLSITMLFQASLFFAPSTQNSESRLSVWKAILIGILQGFGAIPGISRLSTTLAAARWLNMAPHRAFEFSTLMQIIIFIGNFVKNMIIARGTGQLISLEPYVPILQDLSWDCIIMVCVCAILSYGGLMLTKTLNDLKQLWKIAPYFLIPLWLISFFH